MRCNQSTYGCRPLEWLESRHGHKMAQIFIQMIPHDRGIHLQYDIKSKRGQHQYWHGQLLLYKPGIGAAWNGRYPLGPGNSWPQGRYRSSAASRPCSRQRSSSSIYCEQHHGLSCEQRRRQRYQGRRLGIWCGDMAISCWGLEDFRRDRSCSMVIWCYMGMMGCDLSLGFIDVFWGKTQIPVGPGPRPVRFEWVKAITFHRRPMSCEQWLIAMWWS